MTWKELRDKISQMTEEEQQKEVAIWGEDFNICINHCNLEKANEDIYYSSEWDLTQLESELEPEDKDNPNVKKVCKKGTHYIFG